MVNFSRLLLAYAIISLFLTLFGIFGITWYAVEQRKREIAIRKVHGASSRQILLLLNRPFFYYILIADVIAVPIVYVLMKRWREQFVYPANWGIEVFIVPVVLLMLVTFVTVVLNGYHTALSNPAETIKRNDHYEYVVLQYPVSKKIKRSSFAVDFETNQPLEKQERWHRTK